MPGGLIKGRNASNLKGIHELENKYIEQAPTMRSWEPKWNEISLAKINTYWADTYIIIAIMWLRELPFR